MKSPRTRSDGPYLAPAEYVDSDHPAITDLSRQLAPRRLPAAARARAIFHAVRDLRYACDDFSDLEAYRASGVLSAGQGYCVGKAALFAALCRSAGLPAKVAFADVGNHLASPRLRERMGTDVFAWHGYNEVLVEGRWLKVSPTFDAEICARFDVPPLEFDGRSDAVLQAFTTGGRRFMRYLKTHGSFHDVPARYLRAEMARLYPAVAGPGGVPAELRRTADLAH